MGKIKITNEKGRVKSKGEKGILKLPWCSYLPVKDAEFELSLTRLLLALGTSAREMTQSSLTAYSSLNGGKTVG